MFPPDPYEQFDERRPPDATERADNSPAAVPRHPAPPPPPYHEPRAGGASLPLPYDDYDPTYQEPPAHQPPVYQEQQPSTYPEAQKTPRSRRWIFPARQRRVPSGQVYAPSPPIYQPPPPPQQQIIYVRERRPSVFSISCSILSILLLMTCGLVGLAAFRGVTSALQTAGKTIPARATVAAFCGYESNLFYQLAYGQLTSVLQGRITESVFQSDNTGFNQTYGPISSCGRSSNSSDAVSGDTVTILVNVTRTPLVGTGSSVSGYIYVVPEGSSWRISHIDATLNLV